MTKEQCIKNKQCQSCLMTFYKNVGVQENENYCSYCFKDGKLCYEGDLEGFKKVVYKGMRSIGINPIKATFFTWLVRFAPRWSNK